MVEKANPYREDAMRKWIGLAALLLVGAGNSVAATSEESGWSRDEEEVHREVKVLCIDGQKFLYALGALRVTTVQGAGGGTAVSLVQVYEERDGKVVPARCGPGEFSTSRNGY